MVTYILCSSCKTVPLFLVRDLIRLYIPISHPQTTSPNAVWDRADEAIVVYIYIFKAHSRSLLPWRLFHAGIRNRCGPWNCSETGSYQQACKANRLGLRSWRALENDRLQVWLRRSSYIIPASYWISDTTR